jgi:hypothetical protein
MFLLRSNVPKSHVGNHQPNRERASRRRAGCLADCVKRVENIRLDILRLIDYLQPKKTSEGRRLTKLATQVITALCQSASSNAKVEALTWAIFYDHGEARNCLSMSLGSETAGDIVGAISTLDLSTIEEESMSSLTRLLKSNRAALCWHLWAEHNQEYGLAERLKKIADLKPTSRSVALPRILDLNDKCVHDVISYARRYGCLGLKSCATPYPQRFTSGNTQSKISQLML